MATFQVRIEDYTGSISDTAFLTDVLTEGARIIADRLSPDRLELLATDKADSGSGIAVTGGRPLSAHKSGYPATRIPLIMKSLAGDSDSNFYASTKDPSWYVEKTKAYVLPGGGTINFFSYPTVLFSASTISDYPTEALGALVLYGAVQGEMRIISDLVKTTMAAISFSLPTAPTTVSAPAFTFTSPSFGGLYTKMEAALTNKDPELAAAEGGELNLQLQEYSTDIQDQLGVYKELVDEYQGTLGKFNADLASYSAQVGKEVQRIGTLIQQYTTMSAGFFQLLKDLREEYNRALETL